MQNLPDTATESVIAWQTDARSALAQRQFKTAEDYCRKILTADPRNADAHLVLAMLAVETGQLLPAAKLLQRAAAFAPDNPEYLAQLGRVLIMLNKPEQAEMAAAKALALNPQDGVTLDTIGCIYSHTADHDKAIGPFTQATSANPGNPDFHYNLALSQRFLGDFDGAESSYEKAIAADPACYKAQWSLAHLRRQTAQQNHIVRLETAINQVHDNDEAKILLHNGLAKEHEDLEHFDTAFTHMVSSNNLVRRREPYAIEEDRKLFNEIIDTFTHNIATQDSAGIDSEQPIFIVGMPRTGTTLVERIISSHSAVHSAGELNNFGQQLSRLANTQSQQLLDLPTLRAGVKLDPEIIGQAYLESISPTTTKHKRFVDKMPPNFLNIGFIRRSLPQARIIVVRRNPMDTCLSNFRQLFSLEHANHYRYSSDLLDTGRYFLLFDQLIRHWEDLYSGQILQLNYEQLIANQDSESRRLINFCGLGWQDACLHFETNNSAVSTASSAQVRQPVYATAVERWRHYEQHLQPLRQLLEDNGVTV